MIVSMIISYDIMETLIIVEIISTIIFIMEITINNKYKEVFQQSEWEFNGNITISD